MEACNLTIVLKVPEILSVFVINIRMQKSLWQIVKEKDEPSVATEGVAEDKNEDWLIPAIKAAGMQYIDKRNMECNL